MSATRCAEWIGTHYGAAPPVRSGNCNYLTWQREVCPTTLRQHFQFYAEFESACTRKAAQDKLGTAGAHLDPRRGLNSEAAAYCHKTSTRFDPGATPFEDGVRRPDSRQGSRTDLKRKIDEITAGTTTPDEVCLLDPMFYHQFGRTLQRAHDLALRGKGRTWMTKGTWFYGPTGVGKSHLAFRDFTPTTHYLFKDDKGWQDGYEGQETVILNDFRGEIKYNTLLQLLDKWPVYLSRRNREPIPFLAKTIIITSSLSPQAVYHNRQEEDNLDQLLRRLEVVHITDRRSLDHWFPQGAGGFPQPGSRPPSPVSVTDPLGVHAWGAQFHD